MRQFFGFVALCALATLLITPAFAQDALTGEMANSQYLIGTWDCAVTEMMSPGGTRQENGTLTFGIAPGNVMSQTISTPTFAASGYIGWNTQPNKFFSTTVNSMGGISTQTADRGTPGHTVFVGTATEMGQTAQTRDTDDKVSDTKIHSLSEANIGGNWTRVAEATCNKR